MAWRTRSGSPQRRAAGSSSTSGLGAWWPSVAGSVRSRSTSPTASLARMSAGCSGWCSIQTGRRTDGPSCTTATAQDGDTVLSEFTGTQDGDAAPVLDPASERVLLTVDQPFANHNGGQLAFGPDGYLWFGLGDGGSGGDPLGNGQNPFALLGSILRLDVSEPGGYAVPPDNPFADGSGGAPEVYLYGLRNPWRFSFDPETRPALDRRRRPDRLRGDRPHRPGGRGRRQSRLEPDGGVALLRRCRLLVRRARHCRSPSTATTRAAR